MFLAALRGPAMEKLPDPAELDPGVIVIAPESPPEIPPSPSTGSTVNKSASYVPLLPKPKADINQPVLLLKPAQSSNTRTFLIPTNFTATPRAEPAVPLKKMTTINEAARLIMSSGQQLPSCWDDSVMINSIKSLKQDVMNPKNKAVAIIQTSWNTRSHTVTKDYWCNFCTYKSMNFKSFQDHLAMHVFKCEYCNYRSFTRAALLSHVVLNHSNHYDKLIGYEGLFWEDDHISYKGLQLDIPSISCCDLTSDVFRRYDCKATKLVTDPIFSKDYEGCHVNKEGMFFPNTKVKPFMETKTMSGATGYKCFYCGMKYSTKVVICRHLKETHGILVEFLMREVVRGMFSMFCVAVQHTSTLFESFVIYFCAS